MQNNGEMNKAKANQNKSEPSNFETKVIRPGAIRSNLLALLDASTCFNLYSSNKYISKKMNEINDFKKSKIMYIVYLNRLGDFFGDNGKFFSDIVDKIFESDFKKLCNLISTKSTADQKKFYFDNSRKIVSPTFKLYLKMYMTKIILLELLSIREKDFLEYEYESDISINSLSYNDALILLKKTILNNMTKNSQEKRINKIFNIIVKGQEFAPKTFSDEISDDKNMTLYDEYKNQYREINYNYLLYSSFKENKDKIQDYFYKSQMNDPACETLRHIIYNRINIDMSDSKIAFENSFDFFLNHPEEFDNSQVKEILDFGKYNQLISYHFMDYLLKHCDHKNFSIVALQIGLANCDGDLNFSYYFSNKLPNDIPHYGLIRWLLEKRKETKKLSENTKAIMFSIFLFLVLTLNYLSISYWSYWLTFGLPYILTFILHLGFLGSSGFIIYCLMFFVIPLVKKLIHNIKDKILIAEARQIVNPILERLNQNKKAYKDKLDKHFKRNLANVQELKTHAQDSNQPAIENKIQK